uniref:Uncharacterized protein n=1 Tax=Glycine max TaxID=3847 RepID=C6T4F6_SOYBN|nr:unknown [Glycine max]
MKISSFVNQKLYLFPPVQNLFNVLHHDIFNFRNLSFHLSKLAYLFRMLNTVLHVLLQLRPEFLVQAVRSHGCCLSAAVFGHKVILHTLQKSHRHLSPNRSIRNNTISESVVDEVVEGVAVTVVGELVVGGRELLEALERDCVEVATEFSVLGENHRAARHERVDQRSLVLILSHLLLLLLFSQICAFEPDFGNCVVCASVYLHSLLFLFFSFLFFPLREKEQRER